MISIVDYGVGNLQNICNALDFIQKKSKIICNPKDLTKAEKIILPGVGSFAHCMQKIKEYNYLNALQEVIAKKIPLLGICVGMQVLFEKSTEQGTHQGLGILAGEIQKIQTKYKVPHVGWNKVFFPKEKTQEWFYFVHSYHSIPQEENIIIGYCNYGIPIVSVIQKENIWGVQFHPEKSQKAGLKFLQQFSDF